MRLFFYQPDTHGRYSIFVCAASAQEAADSVNREREIALSEHVNDRSWGSQHFLPQDFQEAVPGQVITNDNC